MGKEWFIFLSTAGLHRGRPCRWMPRGRCRFRVLTRHRTCVMAFVPFKGICQVEVWSRDTRPDAPVPALLRKWEYPSMKKKVSKAAEGVKHLAAMETTRFSDLMSLVEHCALRQYDDGDARDPGWLTIKTQGAAWCVQVKDPDAAVSFTAVADTLDKALETAALLLSCDEAPWEMDRFLAQAKGQKKK